MVMYPGQIVEWGDAAKVSVTNPQHPLYAAPALRRARPRSPLRRIRAFRRTHRIEFIRRQSSAATARNEGTQHIHLPAAEQRSGAQYAGSYCLPARENGAVEGRYRRRCDFVEW